MKSAVVLATLSAFVAALPASSIFNPSHEQRDSNPPSASCPQIMAVSNATGDMKVSYYSANPDGQLSLNNHPCHGTWDHDHDPLIAWLMGIFGLDPDGYGHLAKHPARLRPNMAQAGGIPMHLVADANTGHLHGVAARNAEQADEGNLVLVFKQSSSSDDANNKATNTAFALVVPDDSSAPVSQRAVAATAGESHCESFPCGCGDTYVHYCPYWVQCYNSNDAGSKNIFLSSAHHSNPAQVCENVWVIVTGSMNETASAKD